MFTFIIITILLHFFSWNYRIRIIVYFYLRLLVSEIYIITRLLPLKEIVITLVWLHTLLILIHIIEYLLELLLKLIRVSLLIYLHALLIIIINNLRLYVIINNVFYLPGIVRLCLVKSLLYIKDVYDIILRLCHNWIVTLVLNSCLSYGISHTWLIINSFNINI